MSVRINLEIGHEASLRNKRTQEGFTHDWEIFVRGCDGAEIHYYVEKVVFYLHETFQKPKRVIKEPPYSVKESGYAGFTLPIDVYFRNKDEPKKIKFNYDLHLQPTGPAIVNVQKEKYIFNSPNEEFRNKLLRGGGIVVNSLSAQETNDGHTNRASMDSKNELTSKPKLSSIDPLRKNKGKEESRPPPDSFQSLFGTPITKTSKVFPDLKSLSKDINKNTTTSNSSNNSKPEKDKDKSKDKSKYNPNKDRDKDRGNKDKIESEKKKDKDERRSRDKPRERDHSKEKNSKREKSPRLRSISPKRITSPPPIKHRDKEEKRTESSIKEKDRRDEKSDRKPKKDRRDKEKEHKESKYREKESQKSSDYKDHKSKELKPAKEILKEKEPSPLPPPKVERKENMKETIKEDTRYMKDVELQVSPFTDKPEKIKSDKYEEKQKHKHKKRDKDRKDHKDRSHKDKSKDEKPVITKPSEIPKDIKEEKTNSLFSSPKSEEKPKKPLFLFSEGEADSSNSSTSSKDDTFAETAEKIEPKKESIFEPKKSKLETPEKSKKEKNKKNKDKKLEKEEKKRKRKSEKVDEEPLEKIPKEEGITKDVTSDSEHNLNTNKNVEIDKENQENPEDYMQILRDLQSKIMNLQDNAELQKVVQLIAETGRYEVSQRTFDFDLCLLDKSTVRQLQEFFSSST